MNTVERRLRVETQSDHAKDALQHNLNRHSDVGPRLRLAEDVLIEGLSIEQYNEYIRARVALAQQFAQKID